MENKNQKSNANQVGLGLKNSKIKYRLESVGEEQYILNIAGKKVDIHYDASLGLYRNLHFRHRGKTVQEVVNIIVDEVLNGIKID